MKENLIIIGQDGECSEVDLPTPSGITLSFRSNIFDDLSKITGSRSYTISIPMTLHNRRLFDGIEDVRFQRYSARKVFDSQYYQNGVSIINNARLYVDSVSNGQYKAVMVWDVISGLMDMKKSGLSLQELPGFTQMAIVASSEVGGDTLEEFDNTAEVLYPVYSCGLPYFIPHTTINSSSWRGARQLDKTYIQAAPQPVVPTYKLVKLINEHFGTKFQLGNEVLKNGYSENTDKQSVVTHGVIPLTSRNLTDAQLLSRSMVLSTIGWMNCNSKLYNVEIVSVIKGLLYSCDNDEWIGSYSSGNNEDSLMNGAIVPKLDGSSLNLAGELTVKFLNVPDGRHDTLENYPTLTVYQRNHKFKGERPNYTWKELGSVEGVGSNGTYTFGFCKEKGDDSIECIGLQANEPIIITFNYEISEVSPLTLINVTPMNSDDIVSEHYIDIKTNLPDISCFDFIKGLYFMMGAFPTINSTGDIVPAFYNDLQKNISQGKVVDWSSRDYSPYAVLPEELSMSLSSVAQKNYYLMKSDDIDRKTSAQNKEDVYANGVYTISVKDSVIEQEKTVIQLPYNAPFIGNRKRPDLDGGRTMKCWELDSDKKVTWCDPTPCYCVIKDTPTSIHDVASNTTTVGPNRMSLECWDFSKAQNNASYGYLRDLLSNCRVLKITLFLTETDLRDLDYSVPVYLDKYNSFFAIVSIVRDSNGKCKCELLKLP